MQHHSFHRALLRSAATFAAVFVLFTGFRGQLEAEPLRIGYSDWPGWVAWDIGVQKGWFEEEGVEVDFIWFDYVASMDAYASGDLDAVAVTNGDALVMGATGSRSIMIGVNDYSNGNDKVVARRGIESVSDLEGRQIGVEVGFVCHLLLLKALEEAGLRESDVSIVNIPTHQTAQALATGDVDAIAAWQPHSGQALSSVSGATELFTSADVPGLIYDTLAVRPRSLAQRRDDWLSVLRVWYRIVDFIKDPETYDEAVEIMAARVDLPAERYEAFLQGTRFLTLDEAKDVMRPSDGFESLFGSSAIVDAFNVDNEVYDESQNVRRYIDPGFLNEL